MTFEELYHIHKDLVFNLALQYVQNAQDAEEIAQDVFLTVYNKLNTFQQKASPRTWIYRITVNKSLDYIRAKKRNKRSPFLHMVRFDNEETQVTPVEFNHPGVAMEQQEAIASIFDGINKLSENQKTALLLLKIEHLTKEEVGEVLGISPKAVESLFIRAKKNLKLILKQDEGNS
jgi:RNA polymerase sigma-70 factor (ECF subfamily)